MKGVKLSVSICVLFFCVSILNAQTIPGLWKDYFSYKYVKQIHAVENSIMATATHGFWIYSPESGEIRKFSKVQGLSDVNIKTSAYSNQYKTIAIGYESGAIDLIKYPSYAIHQVTAISSKSIYGEKSIRDIRFLDSLMYVATDFGLVVYNIVTNTFVSTTILGESGNYVGVTNVFFTESLDSVSIVTENGLYAAHRFDNIADFSLWNRVEGFQNSEIFIGVYFNNSLYYIKKNGSDSSLDSLYVYSDGVRTPFKVQPGYLQSLSVVNNELVILSSFSVRKYSLQEQLRYIHEIPQSDTVSKYSAVTFDYNNDVWLANTIGIVNLESSQSIYPNGINSNMIAGLQYKNDKLYCVCGSANKYNVGLFNILVNGTWYSHINWDVINSLSVYAMPSSDTYYYGTYGWGLVECDNSWSYKTIYTSENSSIQAHPTSGQQYVSGITSDSKGNVWVLNMYAENPLSVKTSDNIWYSYRFPGVTTSDMLVRQIVIAQNGYKWIAGINKKLAVFYENNTLDDTNDDDFVLIPLEDSEGVFASRSTCVVEDNDGTIWIGTDKGIAIHSAPSRVFDDKKTVSRIKIEIDGEVGYLLSTQWITSILVDGANRKWIGTQNSGVFVVSADGTEQIAHYTKENSPLPSNTITSLACNHETGEVFFGTYLGLVSVISDAIRGEFSNSELYVVPNPVRENYMGDIYIYGTTPNAIFKITTISGNLVYEGTANGGVDLWNGTNLLGERVQTGIYLVYVTNEDGSQTGVTKLMFIH